MITITLEGKEYQLDIEQAEKLGLLKEKYGRVKSWEEFKRKYPNYFSHLTIQESKAFDAFTKLLKLRRDWIGEWEPDWNKPYDDKFIIYGYKNEIRICNSTITSASLSFPSYQLAQEFSETFHDLIEEAKTLI
jgi:hypothetical protein